MSDFKESSRKTWTSEKTVEHINAGSLQRIADACELMAKNYHEMERKLKWYTERYRYEAAENRCLRRRQSALRGVITRLKNKIKKLEERP